MSAGFTPGPYWISSVRDDQFGNPIMAQGGQIVGFAVNMALTPEMAKVQAATALILAAAPDLYEALDQFVAYLDIGEGTLSNELEQAMRDALARARGAS